MGHTVAATSALWPDTATGNCRRLIKEFPRVGEVALCLFESDACLAYGPDDLSPDMAGLPLTFHVHLPLDLPWAAGVGTVASVILGLAAKAAFLSPRAWVLHPPLGVQDQALLPRLAELLAAPTESGISGVDPEQVLVENIKGHDFSAAWPHLRDAGFGVCLDVGHMLAFDQANMLDLPGLAERVGMVHAYGPGPRGEHDPLSSLDARGRDTLRRCVELLPKNGTVVLEVFSPDHLEASLAAWDEFVAEART